MTIFLSGLMKHILKNKKKLQFRTLAYKGKNNPRNKANE